MDALRPAAPASFPKAAPFDETPAFLREGYGFVASRCDRLGTDGFLTRLMLRRVVCLRGSEAAALFYAGDVTRRGAMPGSVLRLLQGAGSVQQLDGAAHRHRKALFLSMMTAPSLRRLEQLTEAEWRAAALDWQRTGEPVVLHDAAREILTRAVCRWAGVPLGLKEIPRRAREFGAMIDGTGSIGPRHWQARLLRRRTERWALAELRRIRRQPSLADPGAPVSLIAFHRDDAGALLDEDVAVTELINVLRPTVAVARFVAFAALALERHRDVAERVRSGDDAYVDAFVQEVRRYYPFFPVVGGRAARDFDWHGHAFRRGDWMLLDLYGTDHHPDLWGDPERFRPERFLDRGIGSDELVPQGGGDHATGHRCPGEWITISLTGLAARLLTRSMRYTVPDQDLSVRLDRIPAAPASGFVLREVVLTGRGEPVAVAD